MLRGAIIGLGNVALDGHLPGWSARDGVEIVAVTDVQRERQADALARMPGARWFDSAEALLEHPGLDFVDICTPPSSHAPLIERALTRGLHVLCEKPLVRSPAELDVVSRLAAERGRVLHTVHNWHHAPIVRRAADLIRDHAIGPVRRVAWQTLRVRPAATRDPAGVNWRLDPAVAGGGILTDHGWHVFYIVQRWIGARPQALSARLERRRHATLSVEDTATVRVTFPDATADILFDLGRRRAPQLGAAGRRRRQPRAAGRHARAHARRAHRAMAVSPRAVQRVRAPGLVRAGRRSVRRGDRHRGTRRQPGRGLALRLLESLARESSRRDGETLPVPPAAVLVQAERASSAVAAPAAPPGQPASWSSCRRAPAMAVWAISASSGCRSPAGSRSPRRRPGTRASLPPRAPPMRRCSRAPRCARGPSRARRIRSPASGAGARQRLVQRRWLRAVLEMPLEPETLYVDGSLAAVVETKRAEAVLTAARDGGAAETIDRLRARFTAAELPADPEGLRALTSGADCEARSRGCCRA